MKFIVRATIPVDTGNEMVKDPGYMQQLLDKVMGDLRPEAVYFCIESGQRTVYSIVNLEKASEWPRIVEPLWLALGCDVEVIPAMSQDEFGEAMGVIAEVAKKY